MMFGQILISGIQMIAKCGFTQKNITITSISLAMAVGLTSASERDLWNMFPKLIVDIFSENIVAVVFVLAMVLSYVLPENMGLED